MNGTMQAATRSVQLRVMSTPSSSLADAVALARRHQRTMPEIPRGPGGLRTLAVDTTAA